MAIPPFPSHDLAKLVLGYLAEEQLMTAYDEFLQASPYLDVLRNEYDRIFMTSLKSILAEYRAVKIYVESCKPFVLRKKIFQCSNLLEVVKFLVNHIDINRIHSQESNIDKLSHNKHTSYSKSNACEACHSLSLSACECRGRVKPGPVPQPTTQTEANSAETSIETTSLADLPGNLVTKRNIAREIATDIAHSQNDFVQLIPQSGFIQPISQSCLAQQISQSRPVQPLSQRSSVEQRPIVQQVYVTIKNPNVPSSASIRPQVMTVPHFQNTANLATNRQNMSKVPDEAKQKIEEFNTIFNLICSNDSPTNPHRRNNFVPEKSTDTPICNAGSFQDFATGVAGKNDKEKPIVPDSSTSENFNTQTTSLKEDRKNITPNTNMKGPVVAQYYVKAGTLNSPYFYTNQNLSNMPKSNSYIKIKEKPDDQKVTILSDVKVDNTYKSSSSNYVKMPQVLRSNSANPSNPMMQMQTIYINGSPAYTHTRQSGTSFAYTKDEIMAMPTIIVVPSSGITHSSSPATYSQSNVSRSTNTMTTTTSTSAAPNLLDPLVIDVSNSPTPKKCSNMPELSTEIPNITISEGLVKTVDATAVSLPKDTNIAVGNKTSTPNVLPPTRKSSSTPRRNSHVRVLDFATPRRILHETINENEPNQISVESTTNGAENISNGSSDKPVHTNILTDDKYITTDTSNRSKNTSIKESKSKVKKNNWDAELRALVLGNEFSEEAELMPKPKLKKTKKKKKKKVSPATEHVPETSEADNTETTHSSSHTTMKSNDSIKSIENAEHPIEEVPTKDPKLEIVNNITACDVSANDLHKSQSQIKINTSDDRVDTPEAERLSLQNVIGAKLNISDLLETPYKQALYDIQMETPKFLGPELSGEPISDIKIMNIPTPRFLNTPKPTQATPSSYASRPTDYSSGSSYYKPDDHDYIPSSDVFQCAETVPGDTVKTNEEIASVQPNKKEISEKSNRPRRKCTKNVSYRNLSMYKMKDNESFEAGSVSSETSNKSTKDKKVDKSIDSKTRIKSKTKSVSKKKVIIYKSPLKPKNFMKIKPRRSTPIKESSKGRKMTSDVTGNGSSIHRKRTTSKDKITNVTPIVATAPTKSRRKSSTPRKLSCTKPFSPKTVVQNSCSLPPRRQDDTKENVCHLQDSDIEQMALRWSDDGSQDAKPKEKHEQPTSSSLHDDDDITKIKEYIKKSAPPIHVPEKNSEGSLQIDLINRGFDAETAKIIERDLLDTTPIQDTAIQSTSNDDISVKKIDVSVTLSDKIESDTSIANNLQIVQEDDEIEEIELSVCECNEESKNFVSCQFDESTFVSNDNISKLKDKFSMELCVDDDLTIRLRANGFTSLFSMDPEELLSVYNHRETEDAVSSISNIDKLYTPLKDTRTQCYEIFDSTLTSIDTPLKSETTYETKVTEIVLEVEKEDSKEKPEIKKRKRLQSESLEESLSKKSKPDTQYLLNSTNIQNIDIESVLSKLHGP